MSAFLRNGSVLARRSAISMSAPQNARAFHVDNVVGKTIPTSVESKPLMAVKIVTFFICGFGLPFGAASYQLSKSAAPEA